MISCPLTMVMVLEFLCPFTLQMPKDNEDILELALGSAKAIQHVNGKKFAVGRVCEIIYQASGSSVDWTYVVGRYADVFSVFLCRCLCALLTACGIWCPWPRTESSTHTQLSCVIRASTVFSCHPMRFYPAGRRHWREFCI